MSGSKVTREIYEKIKKYINDNGLTAKDDPAVQKKFGYGRTTIQTIRNTKNYDDYLARTRRFDGYPRKNVTKKAQPKKDASAKKQPKKDENASPCCLVVSNLHEMVALSLAIDEAEKTDAWREEVLENTKTDLTLKALIVAALTVIAIAFVLFVVMLFVEFSVR